MTVVSWFQDTTGGLLTLCAIAVAVLLFLIIKVKLEPFIALVLVGLGLQLGQGHGHVPRHGSGRRHGRGHRISPSELNFRANIWAMKSLGVKWILSVSAVGSLKEQYVPTHMVTPDQFIDRTKDRRSNVSKEGGVGRSYLGSKEVPPIKQVRRPVPMDDARRPPPHPPTLVRRAPGVTGRRS